MPGGVVDAGSAASFKGMVEVVTTEEPLGSDDDEELALVV
jgi:hypothetical protein